MNTELVFTILKFGGAMLAIMALIGVIILITPRLARFIDRHRKPADESDTADDGVKGLYDAQKDDDFDPNYKIYNEDIYSLKFTKKKKEK